MAEERVNRKLAAILASDVVGYSRLMRADEAGTLAALKRHRETVFDPAVVANNGRIVKLIGDGTIVEFGSVVDAVNCALSVQRSTADQSTSQPPIVLRIGINLGDVITEGDDIYGDGVNIAARLEPLAEPHAWSRSQSPAGSASPPSSMRASAIGSTLVFRMAAK
jgi:adenylate cyclase